MAFDCVDSVSRIDEHSCVLLGEAWFGIGTGQKLGRTGSSVILKTGCKIPFGFICFYKYLAVIK